MLDTSRMSNLFKRRTNNMASSILIVEDEPSIAELISVNLSHEGFLPVRAFQADQC